MGSHNQTHAAVVFYGEMILSKLYFDSGPRWAAWAFLVFGVLAVLGFSLVASLGKR